MTVKNSSDKWKAETAFWCSILSLFLLIFLLFRPSSSSKAVENVIRNAKNALAKNQFQEAYDFLMVASRLNPEAPAVFDLAIDFVDKASETEEEEASALSGDILGKLSSYIFYQEASRITESRSRVQKLYEKAAQALKTENKATADVLVLEIKKNLDVAKNKELRIAWRSEALHSAQEGLDDLQKDLATAKLENPDEGLKKKISQIESDVNTCENDIINLSFKELENKYQVWSKEVSDKIAAEENVELADLNKTYEAFSKLLVRGVELTQEGISYQKAKVPNSGSLMVKIESIIKQLNGAKVWVYNKAALGRISAIEKSAKSNPADKIARLSEIQEDLLLPYIQARFQETWKLAFESLPDETKKLEAIRQKVMGSKQ